MSGYAVSSTTAVSLYERSGGAPAVAAVVDRFYEAILADPLLAPFFGGVDVDRLRAHQRAFVTAALGGPASYGGRRLRDAHADHDIGDDDFDRVLGHLTTALDDCGVAPDAVVAVMARIAGTRAEVVQR